MSKQRDVVTLDLPGVGTAVFHRSPTGAERHRIDTYVHRFLGGLDNYLDLEEGLDRRAAAVRRECQAELWPEGAPEELSEDDKKRLEAAVNASTSRAAKQLELLYGLQARATLSARWHVLQVRVPPGWEDVGNMEEAELAEHGLSLPKLFGLWSKAWKPVTSGNGDASAT